MSTQATSAPRYTCFDVSFDEGVAHIRLNRPDAFNAMNRDFWNELPAIVRDIDDNARARCIVVSSTGKHFSAGMDLKVFDGVTAQVGLVTVLLAAVSLFIGGIGIANVQIISARERTREIGVRLAIGAPRRDVLAQFLFEAVILSTAGGLAGVLIALAIGLIVGLFLSGFSAVPPLWAVVSGLLASSSVGIVAGYWPARQAAALDPVEALRYE